MGVIKIWLHAGLSLTNSSGSAAVAKLRPAAFMSIVSAIGAIGSGISMIRKGGGFDTTTSTTIVPEPTIPSTDETTAADAKASTATTADPSNLNVITPNAVNNNHRRSKRQSRKREPPPRLVDESCDGDDFL